MNLTDARTDADAAADAGPAGPSDESELETSETNVADTDASDLEPGAATYRVVDELDATGRMTLRTEDGTERTVVDCLDGVAKNRLADRARGATVRVELSPAAAGESGEGYVAARVLPGGLPAL